MVPACSAVVTSLEAEQPLMDRHKGQRERYDMHLMFAVLLQARDMLLTAPEPGKHVRAR